MRARAATVALLVASLAACGSGGDESKDDGGRVRVVAAFYPLAEAARRVGGDLVVVEDLTPANVEPHDLELSPDKVDAIEDADVVLYTSGGFQPAVEELAERQGDAAVDVLPGDLHGDRDPHFWLDPRRYRATVATVAEALAGTVTAPAARAAIARRASAFSRELDRLDAEIAAALRECDRRQFVTTHISFGYFNERYDLESASVAGFSPEAEPDADRIGELASFIDGAGITTVFTEPSAPEGIARTLAREAGVDVAVLDPLETRPAAGGGYVSVMRANVEALADALGCSPP